MKITIKHIQGILISNLFIVGLTACSSEPAPWTRPDESPWSEKHAAAKSSADDLAVVEEPVVISEPEPIAEPVVLEEPAPAVAAIAVPEPELHFGQNGQV